ncbi:unnamed protein product [Gongylonema pulchrum]|uniref:Uncharacterized protein n=1 Tax=Gongylonema pulchrum TaxID=637853 RepID=A0A183DBN4_9BILA|nr:unnamed protein product [Gongylonema pulchrum]
MITRASSVSLRGKGGFACPSIWLSGVLFLLLMVPQDVMSRYASFNIGSILNHAPGAEHRNFTNAGYPNFASAKQHPKMTITKDNNGSAIMADYDPVNDIEYDEANEDDYESVNEKDYDSEEKNQSNATGLFELQRLPMKVAITGYYNMISTKKLGELLRTLFDYSAMSRPIMTA